MNPVRIAAKGAFATADLVLPRLRGPRILIYHQVGSGRSHEMNLTVAAFRRQLDWLQTHGEIVRLEDAIERRGESDSHRLFALTFDDGYRDVFVNAYPILKQRRIPFTLYLTSGPIENPGAFSSWPGEALTWDQIRAMIASDLVTVGAHTHTHPDLRRVQVREVAHELDRSNQLITERTGVFPSHFTYPKGWWAPQAHEPISVRYRTATLGGGGAVTELSDLHMIPRVPVQRSDVGPLFRRKLRTGAIVEDRVRTGLRRGAGYR